MKPKTSSVLTNLSKLSLYCLLNLFIDLNLVCRDHDLKKKQTHSLYRKKKPNQK